VVTHPGTGPFDTGEQIWDHPIDLTITNVIGTNPTPLIDGDFVYAFTEDGVACCLDARADICPPAGFYAYFQGP
jgi:hypothetical protein